MSAAKITELTLQSAPKAIMAEYLATWFDGALHSVGNNAATFFPKSAFVFDQSDAPQPLDGLLNQNQAEGVNSEIRILMQWRNEVSRVTSNALDGDGKTVTDYIAFNFYVRTQKMAKGKSNYDADTIAQLLHAIFANPTSRYPLAPLGIRHLHPKKPQAIQNNKFTERLLVVAAELFYTINFNPSYNETNATPGFPMTNPFNFIKENPLVQGFYLLGIYEWPVLKVVTSAAANGFASQSQDTILELEINGAPTGKTLTLPAGDANAPVSAEVNDINLVIPANSSVRWKAASAPTDTAEAAWQVQVVMQVQ